MYELNYTEIGNFPSVAISFPTIEAIVRELERVDADHAYLHATTTDDAAIQPSMSGIGPCGA